MSYLLICQQIWNLGKILEHRIRLRSPIYDRNYNQTNDNICGGKIYEPPFLVIIGMMIENSRFREIGYHR